MDNLLRTILLFEVAKTLQHFVNEKYKERTYNCNGNNRLPTACYVLGSNGIFKQAAI